MEEKQEFESFLQLNDCEILNYTINENAGEFYIRGKNGKICVLGKLESVHVLVLPLDDNNNPFDDPKKSIIDLEEKMKSYPEGNGKA